MRLNFSLGVNFYIFMLIVSVIMFSSCRTIRSLSKTEINPISTDRLLNKIEQNAFYYEYFTVRRINCQYSGNNTKVNFTATLKAQKDKVIMIYVSKLNIPLVNVMFTPDSVKFVNYMEKNYFTDDYDCISKILNTELDFDIIQTILSNNALLYWNDAKNKELRNFETSVENGAYMLVPKKGYEMKRVGRHLKKPYEDSLILWKMFFDPTTFALTGLIIDDKIENRELKFTFADFEKIKDKNYPRSIDMYLTSPENQVDIKLKMNGFSNEIINSFNFNIPENYNKITLN
ncbi:MAG: DUF4292 domain-containing protein [Bacteroidales bacterium]|jgi:hypothetical protein|nr:DUF4292 domain-containing protein [Bacteroidales bacterium]